MNSIKHGLTGAGIVMLKADAAEVERRFLSYIEEFDATSDVEIAYARRAAVNSVRMDRSADQQAAALAEHVLRVEAEFVPPEGLDERETSRMRIDVARRAMFDPSKEATLARKYEAAAERSFFRAIKELQQIQRQSKRLDPEVQAEAFRRELGSYLSETMKDADADAILAKYAAEADLLDILTQKRGVSAPPPPRIQPPGAAFEVPFAIGKPG